MKKIKQVSLGRGRASALPFFYARASDPSNLKSQKCKESQTCLFFLLLAILCKNPFFGVAEGRRGTGKLGQNEDAERGQLANCELPSTPFRG